MNTAATVALQAPAGFGSRLRPRRVQLGVVWTAAALLAAGALWLAPRYGLRHAALFLVGVGCGVVLYQAAFGFTAAFRAFVTTGDGRGLRAQMLMLAVATVLFAPLLSAGEVLGTSVGGAGAPPGASGLIRPVLLPTGLPGRGGVRAGAPLPPRAR